MTIIELKERIDKIIQDIPEGTDLNGIPVLIDSADPSIGAKASEEIAHINMGFDWEAGQVRITPQKPLYHKQERIVVDTPVGDIVADWSGDPSFPGVAIELRGNDVNDTFLKDAMSIAWVEYSTDEDTLRVIVYGDGNEEDYTDLIKVKNYLKKDKLCVDDE